MAEQLIQQPRDFPAVEELLQSKRLANWLENLPRPLVGIVVKEAVADAKARLQADGKPLKVTSLMRDIEKRLDAARAQRISRVLNATGIVVHTNLGRAPLAESIFTDVMKTTVGYGNIEFDMQRGVRGKRGVACEKYLAMLSGAESGAVVNNCAAALFVTLNTLAKGKNVLISRGELVQIGGGFRIPDILRRSGAKLCEVGTTNITTLEDYRSNIDEKTGLILKVHKSNFVQAGFTEEVPLKDLVALGREHNLPVFNDLGSGVFFPTKSILGYAEPTVQQSVRAGADITSFSGDKMLGGVQAGLIVGKADLVKRIKKNPIFRTVRVDKIVFAVLERLLTIYLNGTHTEDIKIWSLLSTPESVLYERAHAMLDELARPPDVTPVATHVYIGGGALPQSEIPSVALRFGDTYKATEMIKLFRQLDPPVIGRIDDDHFLLDLKAVDVDDLPILTESIRTILKRLKG